MLLVIFNESFWILSWGVVIGASLFGMVSDIRSRRIPNALTFPLFIAGLIFSVMTGGLAGLGQGILGCLLLGVPYVLLFLFAGGGAGDAKLMGAIGCWLGVRQSITVLLCVACAGMVMALVKAALSGRLKFVLTSVFISLYSFIISVAGGRKPKIAEERPENSQSGELQMPYGVAICAGVCIAAAVVRIWGVDWLWELK